MNMMRAFQEVPCSPPVEVVAEPDRRYCDFEDQRAGRAVAGALTAVYVKDVRLFAFQLLERFLVSEPTKLHPGWDFGWFGVSHLRLSPYSIQVIAEISNADEKNDDEEIIQWFVAQTQASEQSYKNGHADDDTDTADEVVLGGGPATKLWRGGGVMSRR